MSRSSSKGVEQQECPICSEVKSEFRCMVLINCRHTVCRSCLRSCLTYCGKSGYRCPVAECGKLLEEAEVRDVMEHTRANAELAPVANHWNWNWISRRKESTLPRIEKESESSSYFTTKDFPKLPSSSSLASKEPSKAKSIKSRNVMDEPVPSALRSYESFKSSKKGTVGGCQNEMRPDGKDWDPESRARLRKLIKDKLHKVVDFVFVASEADLSINLNPVECLICQTHINTYEAVSFLYCSSYFCRTCLTQPESRSNDVILLYSDSTISTKKCAVIINREMRSLLRKSNDVPIGTVSSLVSIYENDHSEFSHRVSGSKNNKECPNGASPLNKTYDETSQLDTMTDVVLLHNTSHSSCELCNNKIGAQKGVILRKCFHVLCTGCLIKTIMVTLETNVEVRCPKMLDNNRRCETIVQEREMKILLTEQQYAVYEKKCLEAAVDEFSSSVHCLKPNCSGWIVIEGYKESFTCPVCSSVNCLSCKAIHQGKTCRAYQNELRIKDDEDLSLEAKLRALDSQQKTRCPICKGDNLKPPRCNFIRCNDCDKVFSLPKPESNL